MIPVAGWVAPFGYPRINACSRLPVAFRSVPRPSSPPGAKASTECPSRARDRRIRPKANPDPPCTGTIHTDGTAHDEPLSTSHASERSCPVAWTRLLAKHAIRSDIATTARPETHQNLIHPDKEQRPVQVERARKRRRDPAQPGGKTASISLNPRDDPPSATTSREMVEVIGFEPTTPCLQSRCSPN